MKEKSILNITKRANVHTYKVCLRRKTNSPVGIKHSYEQAINKEHLYKWATNKYPKILSTTQNEININQNEISGSYLLPSYTQGRANVGLQL